MIRFDHDEDGYLEYVGEHPDHYVLNVCRVGKTTPIVLHSAACGTIRSQKLGHGHFTSTDFYKVTCESKDEAASCVQALAQQLSQTWRTCQLCDSKQEP